MPCSGPFTSGITHRRSGVQNFKFYYLGCPKNAATNNSGVIDHIAFLATGPDQFILRLRQRGVPVCACIPILAGAQMSDR